MEEKNKREEAAYLYWLHRIPGIGDQTALILTEAFGSAKAVYFASDKRLREVLTEKRLHLLRSFSKSCDVRGSYEAMLDQGIRLVCIRDEDYPERLRALADAPFILYYLGRLPEKNKPALAMIGARECSPYGSFTAQAFAKKIAASGVDIISGMARGIDGISQQSAVEAGGSTYAVLGCGVDICYPSAHKKLYRAIQERGGILSAYPPGTQPKKTLFPARNKIVAGLSDLLLVIEARQKSGTWITVDMALEQGKNVYAVPGRVTDRLSDGCNLLIKQGAGAALSPEDILAEYVILQNRKAFQETGEYEQKETVPELCREEDKILSFVDFYPKSADEILADAKEKYQDMVISQLLFYLIKQCIAGKVRQTEGGFYVKTGKPEGEFLAYSSER